MAAVMAACSIGLLPMMLCILPSLSLKEKA